MVVVDIIWLANAAEPGSLLKEAALSRPCPHAVEAELRRQTAVGYNHVMHRVQEEHTATALAVLVRERLSIAGNRQLIRSRP